MFTLTLDFIPIFIFCLISFLIGYFSFLLHDIPIKKPVPKKKTIQKIEETEEVKEIEPFPDQIDINTIEPGKIKAVKTRERGGAMAD